MNRFVITMFAFLAIGVSKLQSQEVVDFSNVVVSYELSYKISPGQTGYAKTDLMYLDIGPKVSKFYSRYEQIRDSIKNNALERGISAFEVNELQNGYRRGQRNVYYNFMNDKKRIESTNFVFQFFYYEESMQIPQWKIENETKVILGYNCKKATVHYLGRTWNVFFTPEIPINLGPWKLWGLPGLILQATDKDDYFQYKLNGFEHKTEKKPIIYFLQTQIDKKEYKKVSKKEFKELDKLYHEDNKAFMTTFLGFNNIVITDSDGAQRTDKISIPYIPLEPW